MANAAEVGAYLQASLRAALHDHPHVGEVRGLGLIAGIVATFSSVVNKLTEELSHA